MAGRSYAIGKISFNLGAFYVKVPLGFPQIRFLTSCAGLRQIAPVTSRIASCPSGDWNAVNVAMRRHSRISVDGGIRAAESPRFGKGLRARNIRRSAKTCKSSGRQRRQKLAGAQRNGVGLALAGVMDVQKPAIGRPTHKRGGHASVFFSGCSAALAD